MILVKCQKCVFEYKIFPVFSFSSHIFFLVIVQEPSLFAVAKLLETGLVNMDRIEILWRPLTGHLLEVSSAYH